MQEHLGDRVPESFSYTSTWGGYAELFIDNVLVWKYRGPFLSAQIDHQEGRDDAEIIAEIMNTAMKAAEAAKVTAYA